MNLLFLLPLLLGAALSYAQPVVSPAHPVDVILRTDGNEVAGRVLTITPLALSYLLAAGADTLQLPATDVFLVRYANGTREVLHPLSPTEAAFPDPLPGLTADERRALGRRDADRCYRSQAPFWASLGATLYAGPLVGVVVPAVIAPRPVKPENLAVPRPNRLADAAYDYAYRQEAQRLKRGHAWGGYAVGASVWVALVVFLANSGN